MSLRPATSSAGLADTQFDAVVIGAGPAGCAAALGLARAGLRALIVERGATRHGRAEQPQDPHLPGERHTAGRDRVGESLPPSVGPLLDRLGLREVFLATEPLACYSNRSVWGSETVQEYDFLRDPHGHGWRVDRLRFDAALLEAAKSAGADYLAATAVRDAVGTDKAGWQIVVQGPDAAQEVTAAVVVDATGRASAFARRHGAHRCAGDHLIALTAFLEPAGSPAADTTTLVEATPDGWWYSALLPDGRLLTAFMTDPDLLHNNSLPAPETPAKDPASPATDPVPLHGGAAVTAGRWCALLGAAPHTRSRIEGHGYQPPAVVRAMAAGSSLLDSIAGPTTGAAWLAVGDAAVSFDPLASHGIGAALWSGERAATAIQQHLAGDAAALPAYAQGIARSYEIYRSMQAAYYRVERRWPDAPFWRRRHEASRPVPIAEAALLPR